LVENISAGKIVAMTVFYLMGLILLGIGIFSGWKAFNEPGRGHLPKALGGILVGICLLIIPSIAGWTAGSLGADESAIEDNIFEAEF